MNTIYLKTEKSQRKIRQFGIGDLEKAMAYGFKRAHKDINKEFFIITEFGKCLRFNTQIIL